MPIITQMLKVGARPHNPSGSQNVSSLSRARCREGWTSTIPPWRSLGGGGARNGAVAGFPAQDECGFGDTDRCSLPLGLLSSHGLIHVMLDGVYRRHRMDCRRNCHYTYSELFYAAYCNSVPPKKCLPCANYKHSGEPRSCRTTEAGAPHLFKNNVIVQESRGLVEGL
jgi:hypothetical protein